MARVNRYFRFSKISEARFRSLLRCFALDLTATQAARMTGISVRSVNPIFLRLRQRLVHECRLHSPFAGELEADESYFGPRRVRGRRGRGAGRKTIVFGLLKRGDQVYTEIVPNASSAARFRLNSSTAMKDAIHVSKENYLKAILEAEAEGRQVIPAMLAHWLEVSAPAVTMALKRLKRDGCVKVGDDGIVRLTAAGREMAYRTALRHHLIERMLSEVFGMEWHEIHEEAERLEHAVSPAFEAKLREKLGEGGACPHGNAVLPINPTERKRRGELQLSQAPPGKRYTVISLHERDPKLLEFLHAAGIGPGKSLRVMSQNYDQTVLIDLPTGNVILGRPAAEAVWLRPERSS